MKKLLWIAVGLLLTLRTHAQTNAPMRLALISESSDVAAAADILTAQLSGNPKIHLLERDEIEKAYHEQGMSAANRDDLKLGRILGADGLLVLNILQTPYATNLTARLIAVKPGVILTDGSFPWPLKDTAQWADSVGAYLDAFLPKLTLLPTEAIPISVVNLRSAIVSGAAPETERQLKLLTIQRLSQERQIFVLERQKMQMLGEEKTLQSDESAFWDGSYLLDGGVDQNGFSPDTVTINARLTPPRGGAPMAIEVSGSRTNLAEVVDRLAVKTMELMQIHPAPKKWNAADEATQYFDEATWALRWGAFAEAQAAADSAWALGKHDMSCATLQVEAYDGPINGNIYQQGAFSGPPDTNAVVQVAMEDAGTNHVWGLTMKAQDFGGSKQIEYVYTVKLPDPEDIKLATEALQIYYAFSQTLPQDGIKADSAWYHLGLKCLTAASQVLQHFHFVPESQKPVAEKLADLRSLARSVATLISKSPSVHDSYFTGDRVVTYGVLYHFDESPSIFSLELQYGFLWQENPEDCVALYRELMASPVFRYIHKHFWLRNLQTPRLAAWDEAERQHIPMVWSRFVSELDTSTNVLMQLEGKALAFADADNDTKVAVSFTNLFNCLLTNRDALVANPVEVLYLGWGLGDLIDAKTGNGIVTDTRDSLHQRFYSEYRPALDAMDREYQNKTVSATKLDAAFEEQKKYLRENQPYDFRSFIKVFEEKSYSQEQAREILPLIDAYQSNLLAKSELAKGVEKFRLRSDVNSVDTFLKQDVERILHPVSRPARTSAPPAAPNRQVATIQNSGEPPVQTFLPGQPPQFRPAPNQPWPQPGANPAPASQPLVATNIMTVRKFLPMPLDGLMDAEMEYFKFTDHQFIDGKLVLDFQYTATTASFNPNGGLKSTANRTVDGVALFNPADGHWLVTVLPDPVTLGNENGLPHHSTLWHGELYSSQNGKFQKYDAQKNAWHTDGLALQGNYQLFNLSGHLYATDDNTIQEITDNGKETKLLASIRRQPPASALDTQGTLSKLTLFSDSSHALHASVHDKIYTWTGSNWHEDYSMPTTFYPESFADGVLFRSAPDGAKRENGLSRFLINYDRPEICFSIGARININIDGSQAKAPLWPVPADLSVAALPAALSSSNLFLLVDHSELKETYDSQSSSSKDDLIAKDGYHARLLRFTPNQRKPKEIQLKFEAPEGCPPLVAMNPDARKLFPEMPATWMSFTSNHLIMGVQVPRNANNQAVLGVQIPKGMGFVMTHADHMVGTGHPPGIWEVSMAELNQAFAAMPMPAEKSAKQTRDPNDEQHRQILLKLKEARKASESP